VLECKILNIKYIKVVRTMLFLGSFSSKYDTSGRLRIPEALRVSFSDEAYMTFGFDQNIMLLPPDVFKSLSHIISCLNIADPLSRVLMRMFLGSACHVKISSKGEVVIPGRLAEYAGLNVSAFMVGQGEYVEIWNPKQWEVQEKIIQESNKNLERFAGLDIRLR